MSKMSRFLLTLVALFAMTTGAKAQDVTWTYADVYSDIKTQLDANQAFTKDGISVEWKFNTDETTKSYTITSTSFEISGGHGYFEFTAPEGKKFAKIVLNGSGSQSFCSWNPGYITGMTSTTWEGDEPAAVVNTGDGGWDFILYNPSTFEFYFAEEGTPLTPDADRKVWTLDKMPAGNVELKVTYFPGMLTLASGGNGTLAVDGLTEAFTQLDVPATWDGDNTVLTAAHLPGFKEMSDDAAQKWEGAPKEGLASLIYGFEGTKAKTADYVGGIFALSGTQDLTLSTVKTASADAKIYYSSEAQMPEGFDTDGTNIYVADGTAFKVNVTPAEGYKLASLMFGSEDITAQVKDGTVAVTMPTGNADLTLTATFTDQFDITFNAANANTIDATQASKGTVTVGGTDKTGDITEGKLKAIKMGSEVKLKANNGYKFRKVEAKKTGSAVLAPALENGATVVIICDWGDATTTFTYTNNGGTFSGQASGYEAGYFNNGLELNGKNLSFSAWNVDNSEYLSVGITFNTESSAYSYTGKGEDFSSFTISVNGTDVTDQLSELK